MNILDYAAPSGPRPGMQSYFDYMAERAGGRRAGAGQPEVLKFDGPEAYDVNEIRQVWADGAAAAGQETPRC